MQNQKIRMNKRKFRIGELAKKLKVKKFVIRFWEKEFGLRSSRSDGGQRFYNQSDFDKFSMIKDLLYNKKFTIQGAKKQIESLRAPNIKPATKMLEEKELYQEPIKQITAQKQKLLQANTEIIDKIKNLKQKLIHLKNALE